MSLKRRSSKEGKDAPGKLLKEIQFVIAQTIFANYEIEGRIYLNDHLYIEHEIDEDGYEIIATALNEHFFGRLNIDGGTIIDGDDIEDISEKVLEVMESNDKEAVNS